MLPTTIPIEIIVENIFTFILDFSNDHRTIPEVTNLSLVCSDWAQCFYPIKNWKTFHHNNNESNSGGGDEDRNDELFWRVLIKSIPPQRKKLIGHDDDEKHHYSARQLFLLYSMPILEVFDNTTFISLTGPAGTDHLFYTGCVLKCSVGKPSYLALHRPIWSRILSILHDAKSACFRNVKSAQEFQKKRLLNAFQLFEEQEEFKLDPFNVEYARIYNERIAVRFSEKIMEYDSRAVPGDFCVSSAHDFVEKFIYAVESVQTEKKETMDYYYFTMRKALYQLLLNRTFDNIEISDMVEDDSDLIEREINNPPLQKFNIPFPSNLDEFKSFLNDHCSLILENSSCLLYPCSVDSISFLMFSRHEEGHGFFINIESTS